MESVSTLLDEVSGWAGVTPAPHRFGATALQLGRRELGHVHPDGTVDLPFRRLVRDMLVQTGRAEVHHHLPDSGWVTFRMHGPDDVAEAVELFRLAYERARVAQAVRDGRG